MIKVNIVANFMQDLIPSLSKEFPQMLFRKGEDDIENAEIIWGNYNINSLKNCKKLKFLQALSAGVDAYVKGDFPRAVKLSCSTGAYSLSISEHILALHLSIYRNLHLLRDNQNKCIWKNAGAVKSVKNSVVLVVGLGSIGSAYAKLVKEMGAYVIGVRRSDTNKPEYVDELFLADDLDNVLARADMIVLATPSTNETQKLIDKKRLSIMKNSAMIINIGRGALIDTQDLCDALENGEIAGAGLDVTDPEPLPENHKLWKMDNVIISPHCAGGYGIEETHEIMVDIFKNNLRNFLEAKEFINEVDFSTGYRKI